MRSRNFIGIVIVAVAAFGLVLPAAAVEDQETLKEQAVARMSQLAGPQSRTGEMSPEAQGIHGRNALLFIGVDDVTLFTHTIDPSDNTTTPQFTGFEVWGAALIPATEPGDGVVYFNDGAVLYRWPADGVPEECCTLTYLAATASVVSVAYDPVAGELLFTRNVTTEAVYSLPAEAAACPTSCEMSQDIVYASTHDIGGLAVDTSTGDLYGTNDSTTPGRAVVKINPDGTTEVVVAYPGGETDIDGLTYGNGNLYLVTDQPGDIYVYNLGTAAFEAPLTNPWTSSEIFAGAAFGTGLIPVELQSFSID